MKKIKFLALIAGLIILFSVSAVLANIKTSNSNYFNVSVSYANEVDINGSIRVNISIDANETITNGYLFVVYNPFGFEFVDGSPSNRIISDEKDLIYLVLGGDKQISFDAVANYTGIHDFYIAWRTAHPYDSGNLQFSVNVLDRCSGIVCNDNNPCTNDSCVRGQCVYTAIANCCLNNSECNDAVSCTNDTCVNNRCVYTPITNCCINDSNCNDNNNCTIDSCINNRCNNTRITGCCLNISDCNDNNMCTTDSCVNNACAHTWTAGCCINSSNCDDNEACTLDACVNNQCKYTYACESTSWSNVYAYGTVECAKKGMSCAKVFYSGNPSSCTARLYNGNAYCIRDIPNAVGKYWNGVYISGDQYCNMEKYDCVKAYTLAGANLACSLYNQYSGVAICITNPNITSTITWQSTYGKVSTGDAECAKQGRECLKSYYMQGKVLGCSITSSYGTSICGQILNITVVSWAGTDYGSGDSKCAEKGKYCNLVYDFSSTLKNCSVANINGGTAFCRNVTDIQYPLGVAWDDYIPSSGYFQCFDRNGASCVNAYNDKGTPIDCQTGNIKGGAALCSANEPVIPPPPIQYTSISWPIGEYGSGNSKCAAEGLDCEKAWMSGIEYPCTQTNIDGGSALCKTSSIPDVTGVSWLGCESTSQDTSYDTGTDMGTDTGDVGTDTGGESCVQYKLGSGNSECSKEGLDCVRAYDMSGILYQCTQENLQEGSALCKPSTVTDASGISWGLGELGSGNSKCAAEGKDCVRAYYYGGVPYVCAQPNLDGGIALCKPSAVAGATGITWGLGEYSSGNAKCAPFTCVKTYYYGGIEYPCSQSNIEGGTALCRP